MTRAEVIRRAGRFAPFAFRLAVSVALVFMLLGLIDGADTVRRLMAADGSWIVVALACLTLQTVLMALRWQIVASYLGLHFRLPWAVREYYLAQLVNQTLPGGVVGDAARAVRSRDVASGIGPAAHAVVIERLTGQAGLLIIGLAGFALAAAAPTGLVWPPGFVFLLALAILALLAAGAVIVILGRAGWSTTLGRFLAALRTGLPPGPTLSVQLPLALATAALNLAAFHACARATGTALPFQAVVTLVPLVLTAMLIPLSVGGWGWREGAAAALFPMAGASGNAGVAAGIAYGAVMLIAVLPVLPLLLWRARRTISPPGPAIAQGTDSE